MRPHAKAPSAGSTRRQASRLGRVLIAAVCALALPAFLGIGAPAALADNLPSVSANPAEEVGVTTAQLSGEVNPEGEAGSGPTSWRIEYTPAGESAWTQIDSGTIEGQAAEEKEAVEVKTPFGYFGESQPGTKYEFRIVAENGAGSEEAVESFETEALTAPVLSADPAEEVGYSVAHLSGTIDPAGGNVNPQGPNASPEVFAISYYLQYSPKGHGAWTTAKEGVIEGSEAESEEAIEVVQDLAPGTLKPGTEYEVRVFANWFAGQREAESAPGESEFTTKAAPKPSVDIETPSLVNATTEHFYFAGHVNPNAPKSAAELSGEPPSREEEDIEATFETHWSFDVGGAGGTIAADNQSHLVEAEVEGLQPNTVYTVTLHASSLAGEKTAQATFKTPAAPPSAITGTYTPDPEGGDHAVTVRGYVNPRNSTVTGCQFKYGLTTSYDHSVLCEGDANAVGFDRAATVTAHLTGLAPGATYHFALAATNASGTGQSDDATFETVSAEPSGSCPNETRRTEQRSTFLPNCRAYEQVSPPNKNGGDIIANAPRTRVATDGDAVTFPSLSAFGDVAGTGVATDYMALREPDGWATHSITPSQAPLSGAAVARGMDPLYDGEFSPDLSRGVFRAWSPISPAPNVSSVENLYLRSDLRTPGAGSYQLLSDAFAPIGPFPNLLFYFVPRFASASADFHHVIFQSRYRLTPDAFGLGPKLYEWTGNSLPRLVGLIPAYGETECDDENGPACEAASSSIAGPDQIRPYAQSTHTISADGSKIFFTTQGTDNLYMREDGTRTVQLNISERDPCAADPSSCPPEPATFWNASVDGSRVFFTSQQALTDDAPLNSEPKLYMYDTTKPGSDEHNLTLLSADNEPANGAEVVGVIGASEDGRYVYFAAIGQLVAGASSPNPNWGVYLWHDGDLSYVGSIFPGDVSLDASQDFATESEARVTPDGRHLLFMSTSGSGLTGYDHGDCHDVTGCDEVYLYDAEDRRLSCASCNPSGALASGDANAVFRALGGASSTTPALSRPLSADGRYVFFSSDEAIVSQDTNGEKDAYEYDAATGTVHLLSTGTDPKPSYFMNAAPDGSGAFFLTRQQLVGWDTDQAYDLYDVRSGGGFPEPPLRPAPCASAETCQQSAPPPTNLQMPGTSGAVGPENPKPCHEPKVRRRGKCVKPRRHHKKHHHRADTKRRAGR